MIVIFCYRKLLDGPALTVLCACTVYFASLEVMTLNFCVASVKITFWQAVGTEKNIEANVLLVRGGSLSVHEKV